MRHPFRSTQRPAHRHSHRPGFTLIEVILAMSLSVLVLGLVATAIDIYWRSVDKAQRVTSEAQIARVILDRIAADLRSVAPYKALEIEESDLPEGLTADLYAILEGEELPVEEKSLTGMEDETLDSSSTSTIPQEYGIYGGADWIQIDAIRFPRGGTPTSSGGILSSIDGISDEPSAQDEDEAVTLSSYASGSVGIGAVKTVLYWHEYTALIDEDDLSEETVSDDMYGLETDRHGLFRRELDRAVSLFAQEEGMVEEYDEQLAPIAKEIDAIEFLYFDGAEWLSEWDTETNEALPVAVRVAVAVKKAAPTNPRANDWLTWNAEEEPPAVFSVIILIPTAVPIAEPVDDELTDEELAEGELPANTQDPEMGGGI